MVLQEFVKELIRFGAVHWCPVLPNRAGLASEGEQNEEQNELARRTAIARVGKSVSPTLLPRVYVITHGMHGSEQRVDHTPCLSLASLSICFS